MNKILEKIYSEKDINTNIAIFVSSLVAFFIYQEIKDFKIVVILFIAIFSATKVIMILLFSHLRSRNKIKLMYKNFSKEEREIIKSYVSKGTCLLGKTELDLIINSKQKGLAFDSLMSRGIVKFVDGSFCDIPTGFQLKEDIYRSFLK